MSEGGGGEILCGRCGYNLRGLGAGNCPECGVAFDPAHLSDRLVPWERRRAIGAVRAYLLTVEEACLHPRRLGGRAAYPMSLRAARKFRQITWLVAGLSFVGAIAAWRAWPPAVAMLAPARRSPSIDLVTWWDVFNYSGTSKWFEAALLIVGFVSLWLLMDLPRPLLCLKRRGPERLRAAAVSCYTCAPLVLLPVALGVGLIFRWLAVRPIQDALLEHWLRGIGAIKPAVVVIGIACFDWVIVTAIAVAPASLMRRVIAAVAMVMGIVAVPLLVTGLVMTGMNLAALIWLSGH